MRTRYVILRSNGNLAALRIAEKDLDRDDLGTFHACLFGAISARMPEAAWQEALESAVESVADYKAVLAARGH